MDDLASVRYNVTGNWSEPKMEVDKIFESQADKKNQPKKKATVSSAELSKNTQEASVSSAKATSEPPALQP